MRGNIPLIYGEVKLPFNGSGSFTLAESAFVPSTPISSSAMNSDLSDIATNGLTNAVTKDGQTTITAPFKGANGSVGLPMYSFASDTNTGMYRHGADELGFSTAGTLAGYFGTDQKLNLSTGIIVVGTVAVPAKSVAVASLADGTANRLYGTNGSGVIGEITPGTGLTLSSSTLTAVAQLGRGYIDGCTISNGTDTTNDINIAAGVCRDSTNAVNITVAAMAGKQLDANWAPGAGAGMRNSASGIANGTYHIYAVSKADGTQDIYAYQGAAATDPDSSGMVAATIAALQAESGGASYLFARRIASILREGATIIPFFQTHDTFYRTYVADFTTSTVTALTLRTFSIPLGLVLRPLLAASMVTSTLGDTTLQLAPAANSAFSYNFLRSNLNTSGLATDVVGPASNTSSQVYFALTGVNISSLSIGAHGWIDARGKDN